MKLADSYVALARYNRWMNEKLYAVAAELSDEERKRDLGAFFESVHATLACMNPTHAILASQEEVPKVRERVAVTRSRLRPRM